MRRRRPRVGPTPLTRQESTDQLPISLALYGAWTHPGRNTVEELEAVKAAVRELHPDLGVALDRAVAANRSAAQAQAAAAPREEVPTPRPAFAALAAATARCKRGDHAWRGIAGMGVEQCDTPGCREIRTVA